ncbi:RecQ family ATP-dependent DNA helicase [Neptuniibacter sp. QD37_11]|uniref:RecQ family ATP-dependent DNA helicase n=1 Tax=Neptuniibacter sp. QD37_11 TaxID=3398209 RepID=UPI0039F5169E
MDIATSTLQQYFGHSSFRDGQEASISACLNKQDALTILQTGSGKSICYQIPALINEGVTIVVSPLIALMKDQVDALRHKGISAAYLNSTISPAESMNILQRYIEGSLKLLYVSPERFANDQFWQASLRAPLYNIVVDESHCISLWGHDFRLHYSALGNYIRELEQQRNQRITVSAFTATATPDVQADIVEQLKLNDPELIVQLSARDNIEYHCIHSEDKNADILNTLRGTLKGPTIIYCNTIKEVESVFTFLRKEGVECTYYHGKLSSADKVRNQEAFVQSDTLTLIATKAFGMGIDKSNIRTVIHASMPDSLENYSQESGRAGRDGKPSKAFLIYSKKDRFTHQFFIDNKYPSLDQLEAIKFFVCTQYLDMQPGFTLKEIAAVSPYDLNPMQVKQILGVLEHSGAIAVSYFDNPDVPTIEVLNPSAHVDDEKFRIRRRVAAENLNIMEQYCRSKLCRKRSMQKHFGDNSAPLNCHACDNCFRKNLENEGITEEIPVSFFASVLNNLILLPQPAKKQNVIGVSLGIENPLLNHLGLTSNSAFGNLRGTDKPKFLRAFVYLQKHGLITINNDDLKLTKRGSDWLMKPGKLSGSNSRPQTTNTTKKIIKPQECNETIHFINDGLKLLRRKAAKILRKGEFLVLSNLEIRKIATSQPTSLEELSAHGIKSQVVQCVGNEILDLISQAKEKAA